MSDIEDIVRFPFPTLDPVNNEEHRCLCGSQIVKAMRFARDEKGKFRIYCKPCYERDIWDQECTEQWTD